MSEVLASLKKKGVKGYSKCLAYITLYAEGTANTWTKTNIVSISVTNPSVNVPIVMYDENVFHVDNGDIVVDKAISKAYISGRANASRNSSGARVYSGIRVKKNGTLITGASVMGTSSAIMPYFTRIETSLAVGDVLSLETNHTDTPSVPLIVSIVTD